MDLKSMLNDSQGQRGAPRVSTHTPHSSYDARVDHTPSSDVSSTRPTAYGPPLQTGDPRAQGGSGYFAMQSPRPNTSASASTPSVGPHSAYAQSPGSHAGGYTPRDSLPTSNPPAHAAVFVSPSPSGHHPPTPASAHHQNYPPPNPYGPHNSYPPSYQQFQSPPPPQPNGLPPSHARQISPPSQFQGQPATPLGPPILYPKVSPQNHRPPSQGTYDHHLRRASQGSISSVRSRDYNHYPHPLPAEPASSDSVGRPYPYDVRERSRSESVSPKTIPRPPPQREHSTSSHTLSHGRPSIPPQPDPQTSLGYRNSLEQPVEPPSVPPLPHLASSHSVSSSFRHPSVDHTMHQSPGPAPLEGAPVMNEPSSLKRSASHLSDTRPPPQKRPRGQKPIWACSARGDRPLRFIDAPPNSSKSKLNMQQRPPISQKDTNLQPRPNGAGVLPKEENSQAQEPRWENTIANIIPFESLTRKICDWIFSIIGHAPPPKGSTWEIEAKVGAIMDTDSEMRISLPMIDSEVLLNRDRMRGTRWDSSMNIHQHKALNEYLNGLVQQNMQAIRDDPQRQPIFYDHPKENDDFFELSDEGKAQLNHELLHWISKSHPRRNEVRVRRTISKTTGEIKAQIIKTRIADKDIYNPDFEFDFRISISLESAWDGPTQHLIPLAEARGRNKDRLSYRHMMYQIDLTQVSHDESDRLEHELEVEVSTEYLQQELERLRAGEPCKYEDMIRGLVDNVRLLCRKGSVNRR